MTSGEGLFGTFLQIGHPATVEVLGRAGFDFAIVDFEHGGIGRELIGPLVRAADVVGLPLLIRLTPEELSRCSQMLDLGVTGLLVPRVTRLEQAEHAVSAVRYRPLGERGACPEIRASDYGWIDWKEHQARAEARTIVGVGLEGEEGLRLAEAISVVAGVDFLFVGVFDLAQSIGYPGEVEHPHVVGALHEIVVRAAAQNVAVGTWAPDLEVARKWRSLGVSVVTVATDVMLWRQACINLVAGWREADVVAPPGAAEH